MFVVFLPKVMDIWTGVRTSLAGAVSRKVQHTVFRRKFCSCLSWITLSGFKTSFNYGVLLQT